MARKYTIRSKEEKLAIVKEVLAGSSSLSQKRKCLRSVSLNRPQKLSITALSRGTPALDILRRMLYMAKSIGKKE